MPIGPETHRVLPGTVPISYGSSKPDSLFFLPVSIAEQKVDPTVVIEIITSPPDPFIKGHSFLFPDEGGFELALWKNTKDGSMRNFLIALHPKITQETRNFFQGLTQERLGGAVLSAVFPSALFPLCYFINEGDHAGLHLEHKGRHVLEILPDHGLVIGSGREKPIANGTWRIDSFSYRLDPASFEFVATHIRLENEETEKTVSLVGGLSFVSTDFEYLRSRLRELVTGDAPVKEARIREEVINPYVRLLEEGPI